MITASVIKRKSEAKNNQKDTNHVSLIYTPFSRLFFSSCENVFTNFLKVCYLLSLFGNDYVNFDEDEDDIFQRDNILIDQDSPFFRLFSDNQKLKV